jgi:hypothetical protein
MASIVLTSDTHRPALTGVWSFVSKDADAALMTNQPRGA